ncbi:MAG: glycosyltransferase [Gammaproteobacteria bacterium]|jgi:O-antigen biosynthesis protein|nr:glycosyltransferase [Gammaproteobacteria bacterium]MBT5223458.1 glycosyltransferase [Gammaproteobacteria bacterium]MBT6420462.1 glycosyltransferase [Gammaproteobacteria bacterium]MBT6576214.1 glycosyltransferase [Gammaproteobacteria bacterium]MBT7435642.1 glycosyltransferase [Gammaproteobacteria bacterium]
MSDNKYDFTLDTAEKNDSHMGLASRIKPNQSILELGCSSGYLSKFLAQELDCKVVGVDINKNALLKAAPYCQQTIVADLDTDTWLTEIQEQQFDVVLCADVLEHLKDPVAMLASLKPFLHQESRLLTSVPNVAHASIRLELLQGHFDYEKLGLLDDTHLHFYTRDGLIAMLMQAGYVCCDISYSIQDLADEAIDQHLANAGLKATKQARELLHAPDATAYQFIIEARPVQSELAEHLPQSLTPKPLVSSGVFYGEKQEKIVLLEQQLGIESEHNKHHQIHIQQLDKHHQIHIQQLDSALFDLSTKLQQETEKNNHLSSTVTHLQDSANDLTVENQHLEQVLLRVHKKMSYRMVRGVKNTLKKISGLLRKTNKTLAQETPAIFFNYDAWLATYGNLTKKELSSFRDEANSWQVTPRIAVLMPVYNPDKACLVNAIESVLQQVYVHFELCIADDASTASYVREVLQSYMDKDPRVKVIFREQNGHISAASNSALSLVEAEYVALMDHDDLLTPDALYWVAKTIRQNPDVQLIYSDEDKMDLQGKRYAPYFKPDWNPELLLSHNYICHLGVYKTEKIKVLGGFDSAFDGAQDYDLVLRYMAELKAEQIVHIPRILYHWRAVAGSTATGVQEKSYAEAKITKAVASALERQQRPAEVIAHKKLPGALRVHYLLPETLPLVSIVIPTRNGFHLLQRCIESIVAKTTYANYELIIIDNGSDDLVALRYLQRLQESGQATIIRDDSPFNYAALNNKAVAQANGEIIALLNNDLEVINADWLGEMVSHVVHAEVGAVGAKLYYPDDSIQHAGVIVGLGGVAGHSHKQFPRDNPGYCGRLLLTQNLTAVTAACLLVRKDVFDTVGGFDAQNLSVAFNDVDLCLRLQDAGFYNVWTPYAEMYHYESASRGYEDTPEKQVRFNKEVAYMKQRWGEGLLKDPAYNPNLTLDREDFSFAWPPRNS